MNRFARVGQLFVAALFVVVLAAFWYMMIFHGRGSWLMLSRRFVSSGMFVDMHSFLQFNIIGIPIAAIAVLRALQMIGRVRPHEGIRFANRLFLGMGLAVIATAVLYFGIWERLAARNTATVIEPPSDERLAYPELPLRMAMEYRDLEGNPLQLEDLKGKVVFFNIWATWCGYCKFEFPNIQRLYEEFKDDARFAFILVSDENTATVKAWLESEEGRQYSLPFYTTEDFGRYGPDGYPTTYIIAPDGQTVFSHSGFVAWDGEKTRNFLRALAQ
jgi:thiol-disulfide isomerase/thioredoxin